MKTKDLFKTIEAANFVASKISDKRVFVHVETLEHMKLGYVLELTVNNVQDNGCRFYDWDAFAASIAADYTEDVCKLVAKEEVADHGDGVFTVGKDGFALRFIISRE